MLRKGFFKCKKSIALGQQTAPHCVSALGACGKNHGGGPPAARVPAQHLALSQLYQILQSLLIHLHTHTHTAQTLWQDPVCSTWDIPLDMNRLTLVPMPHCEPECIHSFAFEIVDVIVIELILGSVNAVKQESLMPLCPKELPCLAYSTTDVNMHF